MKKMEEKSTVHTESLGVEQDKMQVIKNS